MKKLIIAVSIIASAVIANAASVMWSVGAAYDPVSGDELGDVTGYYAFFLVDSVTDGSVTTYGYANAVSQVAAGNVAFISNAIGGGSMLDYGGGATTADVFANSSTVTAYLVLLNADNAADATLAYLSNTLSTDINSMGASSTLDWGDMTATATAGNWSTVGVPEPTSGLMLILGVAGLALKRERA